MTRYNSANVKLSNVQLNNLQPGTKNGTGVTLNLSTNVIILMRLIFDMNYCQQIGNFQGFVNLLRIIHQLM